MLADGASSDHSQRSSLHLCVAESLCALKTLKGGGGFVMKLFDCSTPCFVHLLFILHLNFKRLCITKPPSSRIHSSERYLVCLEFEACAKLPLLISQLMDLMDKGNFKSLLHPSMHPLPTHFTDFLTMQNILFMMRQKSAVELTERICAAPSLYNHLGSLQREIARNFTGFLNQ